MVDSVRFQLAAQVGGGKGSAAAAASAKLAASATARAMRCELDGGGGWGVTSHMAVYATYPRAARGASIGRDCYMLVK